VKHFGKTFNKLQKIKIQKGEYFLLNYLGNQNKFH